MGKAKPLKPVIANQYYLYRLLRHFLRFSTRVFFRNIEVVGREQLPNPENSAVIFCGNHPNSLLDPVLITAWCQRIVHFAAKDVLFSTPLLGRLLRLMGAVPVRRRRDHKGETQSNDDAFRDLTQVLLHGGAMGIFPEGISHDASQLVPLKTGAARIALGALAADCSKPIYLVPVGLVYFTRKRFRSSVLIQFGAPIAIKQGSTPQHAVHEHAQNSRVHELTQELDQRLRALTVNAETWETLWVLDGVRRLYQPANIDLAERVRLARVLNESYPKIANNPDVMQLYDGVRDYLLRLSADNLEDRVVAQELGLGQIALRVVAHLTLLFVSLPLFLLGAPIFMPLGIILKFAGVAVSPRSDTIATTKFFLGGGTMLCLYLVLVGWTFLHYGPWHSLLAAIVIPSSGGATIHVIARANALRHLMRTTLRIFTLRNELKTLARTRCALVQEVQATVSKYRESILD